jgi:hypothetical protein
MKENMKVKILENTKPAKNGSAESGIFLSWTFSGHAQWADKCNKLNCNVQTMACVRFVM